MSFHFFAFPSSGRQAEQGQLSLLLSVGHYTKIPRTPFEAPVQTVPKRRFPTTFHGVSLSDPQSLSLYLLVPALRLNQCRLATKRAHRGARGRSKWRRAYQWFDKGVSATQQWHISGSTRAYRRVNKTVAKEAPTPSVDPTLRGIGQSLRHTSKAPTPYLKQAKAIFESSLRHV